jgi:hypothetical protein
VCSGGRSWLAKPAHGRLQKRPARWPPGVSLRGIEDGSQPAAAGMTDSRTEQLPVVNTSNEGWRVGSPDRWQRPLGQRASVVRSAGSMPPR